MGGVRAGAAAGADEIQAGEGAAGRLSDAGYGRDCGDRGERQGPPGDDVHVPGDAAWVAAFKGGKPTYGDFLLAGPISDAFNLGAVSLRLGGRRLLFDAANMRVTNLPEANKYLLREYRTGWELTGT